MTPSGPAGQPDVLAAVPVKAAVCAGKLAWARGLRSSKIGSLLRELCQELQLVQSAQVQTDDLINDVLDGGVGFVADFVPIVLDLRQRLFQTLNDVAVFRGTHQADWSN